MLKSTRAKLLALALTAGAATAIPALFATAAPDAPKPAAPAGAGAGDFAKPPVKVVVPDGFERVQVGGHTALCQPNDVEWVKQALTAVKAADKVPGGPQDMKASITGKNKDLFEKQLKDDLGVDAAAAGQFINGTLAPALDKLDTTRPPLFYLVTTNEKLLDLCKNGWGEPVFHYNRVANAVEWRGNVNFVIDKEMDDTVLPAVYDPKADKADRIKGLTGAIQNVDANLSRSAAGGVGSTVFAKLVEFVNQQIKPLNLKPDQAWLGTGITNCLAAKYLALFVPNATREQIVGGLIQEPQNFPISTRSIDLLYPTDPKTINEALQPYYANAVQRKSIWAVYQLMAKAGDAPVADALKAIRATPPADGKALVKLLETTTKVDVTPWLSGIGSNGLPTTAPAPAAPAPK
jgi:hypothetical protein